MKPSAESEAKKPSVVIDTQVWVAGLLNPRGAAAKVVKAFEDGLFTLALSEPVFDEYERVLSCFAPAIGKDIVDDVLVAMLNTATVVIPLELALVCRDMTDNKFVECAVTARAQFIATKNVRHFPTEFEGVRVVRVSEFLRSLGL